MVPGGSRCLNRLVIETRRLGCPNTLFPKPAPPAAAGDRVDSELALWQVSVRRSMDDYSTKMGYADKTILAQRVTLPRGELESGSPLRFQVKMGFSEQNRPEVRQTALRHPQHTLRRGLILLIADIQLLFIGGFWQGEMVVELSLRAKVVAGIESTYDEFGTEMWAPGSPSEPTRARSGSALEVLEAVEFATARTESGGLRGGVAPPQSAPGSPADRLAEVETAVGGFSAEESILSPAQRYRRDRAASQGRGFEESPNPFMEDEPRL